MVLLDTNILLEILLKQEKSSVCKKFVEKNLKNIHLSDFSLHSIGVILLRHKKIDLYQTFLASFINKIQIVSLSLEDYATLLANIKTYALGFDDVYQLTVAQNLDLELITLDTNFKKVQGAKIGFL